MPDYIIHVLITLVAIPMVMFFFMRLVNRADVSREREESQWRRNVMQTFERMEKKLTEYCVDNRDEHNNMYGIMHRNSEDIRVIKTVQHQHGCDQPRRITSDS